MENSILIVKDLKKTFYMKNGRNIEAVKGISFDVKRGEVFGFLGPNGAGKSTTISMVTTQRTATAGEIILDGKSLIKDPAGARRVIGVVAQHNNLDRGLTARENLSTMQDTLVWTKKLLTRRRTSILKSSVLQTGNTIMCEAIQVVWHRD